jgi:hypothetical protein
MEYEICLPILIKGIGLKPRFDKALAALSHLPRAIALV